MATMPIDFSLLERDELEEELQLRGITEAGANALKSLSDLVSQEEQGARPKPLPSKNICLNPELNECREKLALLQVNIGTDLEAGRDIRDSAYSVRLWHLKGKACRLLGQFPSTQAVATILDDIQLLINKVISVPNQLQGAQEVGAEGGTDLGSFKPQTRPNVLSEFMQRSTGLPQRTNVNVRPTGTTMRNILPAAQQVGGISEQNRRSDYAWPPPQSPLNVNPGQQMAAMAANFPAPPVQNRPDPLFQPNQVRADYPAQHNNHYNLGHAMSRWPIRFPGPSKIPIDEFIFRVESLARADNIPAASLMLGMHFLLEKGPADFHWNFLRKNPEATWVQCKAVLQERYATLDSDVEIRKAIADRRQLPGEEFGEFCLAIESLANRLRRAMDEGEIIDYLRQNMNHRLQTVLLLHPIYTIRELQAQC